MCCSPLLNDATIENDDRRQGLSEHRHNHVIGHQSLGQKPSFYLGQDRWVGDPAPTPGYAAFMRAGVASIPATSMVTVLIASSYGRVRIHSRITSLTRVCQPLPVAFRAASTSASNRMVVGTLSGAFCGPRGRRRSASFSRSSS